MVCELRYNVGNLRDLDRLIPFRIKSGPSKRGGGVVLDYENAVRSKTICLC